MSTFRFNFMHLDDDDPDKLALPVSDDHILIEVPYEVWDILNTLRGENAALVWQILETIADPTVASVSFHAERHPIVIESAVAHR